MRNRRAAQESRDRKKRQFEVLEEENRRLQDENAEMKRRIEQLEAQQQQYNLIFDSNVTPPPAGENDLADEAIVKTEVFSPESFDMTFHPAEMEFNDPQCRSISLAITTPFLLAMTSLRLWQRRQLQLFSTLFSLMTKTWISLLNVETPAYLLPATFNSSNTGSLFTGAENRLCRFTGQKENECVDLGRGFVDRLGNIGRRLDWYIGAMYPIK